MVDNEKKKIKYTKVDDFFQLDSYQLIVLFFNELLIFTILSNVVFNIFGVAQPKLLGCDDVIYNGTKLEKCEQYDNHLDCQKPTLSYEFISTVVDFNELCSRHENTWMDIILVRFGISNKPRFSTTIQMIGLMFGSAISGQLSDKYGRKKTTLVFLTIMLICTFLSSFSPNIDYFIIARFFIGICCGALNTVSTIFIVENLPSNHRMWMSTVVTWAPNYLLFALSAYISGHWRLLARISNVVNVFAIFVLTFLMPESVKYLVQSKKHNQAIEALDYINKFKNNENKASDEEISNVVMNGSKEDGREKAKNYNVLHLYSTTSLAIRTVVISFGMFCVSYVTYGLIFNLDVIQGSIYLNTAFSGCLRWIVGASVATLDHFGKATIGRKRMHFITMSTIMMCMAGTFIIKVSGMGSDLAIFIRIFTLVAFGATGCLFLQYLLVTAEMFPTCIRSIANSHMNVFGRLGNVFGPMVFSLGGPFNGFPYLLLSILCFLDVSFFQIFIPETKGHPLPTEMPTRKKKIQSDILIKNAESDILIKNP